MTFKLLKSVYLYFKNNKLFVSRGLIKLMSQYYTFSKRNKEKLKLGEVTFTFVKTTYANIDLLYSFQMEYKAQPHSITPQLTQGRESRGKSGDNLSKLLTPLLLVLGLLFISSEFSSLYINLIVIDDSVELKNCGLDYLLRSCNLWGVAHSVSNFLTHPQVIEALTFLDIL